MYELALLILNYFALAGLFIYRYLNPGESSVWIQQISNKFYRAYAIAVVLLCMLAVLFAGAYSFGILFAIFAVLYLAYILNHIRLRARSYAPDILLFILSLVQELWFLFNIQSSAFPQFVNDVVIILICIWYVLGIFGILYLAKGITSIINRKFPDLDNKHTAILLKMKKYKSTERPAMNFSIGIAYCLWMLIKAVLLWYYLSL